MRVVAPERVLDEVFRMPMRMREEEELELEETEGGVKD